MTDLRTAKSLGHRRNIERYCRLLATELTDLERQYLHKRIAEEHAQLERTAMTHIAIQEARCAPSQCPAMGCKRDFDDLAGQVSPSDSKRPPDGLHVTRGDRSGLTRANI